MRGIRGSREKPTLSRLSRSVAFWFFFVSLYTPAFWVISAYDVPPNEVSIPGAVSILLALLPLLVFWEFAAIDRERHQDQQEEVRQAYQSGYADGAMAERQTRQ